MWPAPQVHVELAAALVESAGQSLQVAVPATAKVLAEHRKGVVVAAGQALPAGQGEQPLALDWLVEGLYAPALQLVGLTDF